MGVSPLAGAKLHSQPPSPRTWLSVQTAQVEKVLVHDALGDAGVDALLEALRAVGAEVGAGGAPRLVGAAYRSTELRSRCAVTCVHVHSPLH